MVKKFAQDIEEQMTSLDPAEVTFTAAPAVREEWFMTKNEDQMTEEELTELAKSLGIEDPKEDWTPEQTAKIQKSLEDPASPVSRGILSIIRKAFGQAPPAPGAPPGGPPAPGVPEDPNKPKPNPFAPPEPGGLDKSVSQSVTMAAKFLAPVMMSLPPEIQKFFGAAAPAPEVPMAPMMKSELADLLKSEAPELITEITAPIQKSLDETIALVTVMKAERDLNEMIAVAKSMGAPEPEAYAAVLQVMKNNSTEEGFKAFQESQKAMFEQAKSSDAFKQISGGSIGSGDGSATGKLLALADEVVAKSNSDKPLDVQKAEALTIAIEQNPDLARQYEAEQRQAMKNTGG